MKNKIILLNLMVGVLAVGCSQSAYVPNAGLPAYSNGVYPNTGVISPYGYTNGVMPGYNQYGYNQFNPMMQTPYTSPFMIMQQQQQNQMMMAQQQNVFSWNARMTAANYYLTAQQNQNCIPRQCYNSVPSNNYSSSYVSTSSPSSSSTRYDGDYSAPSVSSSSSTTSRATTTSSRSENNSNLPSNSAKILPLTIMNADAEALYNHLEKEEVAVSKIINTRMGENYTCIEDSTDPKAVHYHCDLEIRMTDGAVLQNPTPGKTAPAMDQACSAYSGPNTSISDGTNGLNAGEGSIILGGTIAGFLYKNLPGTAIAGKADAQGKIDANIKVAGQVRCSETLTSKPVAQCTVKIKADTGTSEAAAF